MGIRIETIGLIEHAVQKLGGYECLKMCELGNQQMRGIEGGRSAKRYFKKRGVYHLSVDMNGKDGALSYDLSSDLSYLGEFDVVTNYGTSEHVRDQYQVFKNIHDLTRIGGMMVHAIPMFGYWPGHGKVGYGADFLNALATFNGYHIHVTKLIERALPDDNVRLLVSAVLEKTDKEFISRETFWKLGVHEYNTRRDLQEVQRQATA